MFGLTLIYGWDDLLNQILTLGYRNFNVLVNHIEFALILYLQTKLIYLYIP